MLLSIISIESEIAKRIVFDDLINEFTEKQARKILSQRITVLKYHYLPYYIKL